jgi:hypothetical protein
MMTMLTRTKIPLTSLSVRRRSSKMYVLVTFESEIASGLLLNKSGDRDCRLARQRWATKVVMEATSSSTKASWTKRDSYM